MAIKKSLKDLSYLFSANVIIKVLGLVSLMIYTRVLLKEELAVVPAFTLLSRLSMVMFSFGVLPCLIRDIPSLLKKQEFDTVQSFIRTCLILVIPGVALFSVLCFLFADKLAEHIFDSPDFGYFLRLLSVGIFFNGVSQLFSYIYWSMSKFKHESKRMVVVGIIKVITGIFFVLWIGVEGLILSLVISSFANSLIYAYNLKRIIFVKAGLYSFSKLFKTSWPFYLESYLMYIRGEGDQLIVTSLLGAEALAIYFVARRPFELVKSFTTSLDRIVATSLSELKEDIGEFSNKVNTMIMLNLYILLPLICLAMGLTPMLILLIAGPGYEQAVVPAILLLLTLLSQFFWTSTFGRSIFILSSSTSRFKMTFIESIALLILIFILGQLYVLPGIVLGKLLATIITGVVAFTIVRRKINLNIKASNIWAIVFISLTMFVFSLLFVQYVSTNYFIIVGTVILSGIGFLLLINITISDHFYKSLNTVSPIKLKDPIKYLISKVL